jgi:glycosyltransferase involved in cell wall biosynthesis
MRTGRLNVLVISELFPNPPYPAFGIFVERQTSHLQPWCNNVVVAPVRVFPPLRIWKQVFSPVRFLSEWRKWRRDLQQIPPQGEVNGLKVFYPRYTSPPKQIAHGLWGFFAYPFLAGLLQRLHREYHFNLIHAHYASPCGVIALLARRWMKVPVVLSIHGADVTYTAKQNPLSAAVIRWVFRNVDAIIANSTWTAQQIVRYGGSPDKVQIVRYGGSPDKVQIVHLGGNPPKRIELGNALPPRSNDVVLLLSVGYLEERKGHAYVLRALKELRQKGYNLYYKIVGDGSQKRALETLTRELGLDDVVSFEGYKSHSEVWPYFAECDIFVLPSWDEAFGIVYIEALALGKPVIGCEGEGGPEDLKALGDCIELVKPRDVGSLVSALQRLIENPERRRQMGEIGRRIVEEHFTWERNAADTMRIYRQVLEAPRA